MKKQLLLLIMMLLPMMAWADVKEIGKNTFNEIVQNAYPQNLDDNYGSNNYTDIAVTGGASNVSYSSITLSCYVNNPNDGETFVIGIRYSTEEVFNDENVTITKQIVTNYNKGNYSFTFDLMNLENTSKYYYQAFVQLYSNQTYYYGETLSFTPKVIQLSMGESVDMGISVKWASTNLGADQPEQDGGYYAYGEIEEKDSYSLDNYKYYDSNTGYLNLGDNISGNKYFDAATAILGENWRIPTYQEFMELKNNSITAVVNYKGRKGFVIESTVNGNTIFMPYNGVKNGSQTNDYNILGSYWAATYGRIPGYNSDVNHWEISHYGFGNSFLLSNSYGLGIRPVTPRTEDLTEKCSTPVINIVDGKLIFTCDTEGVIYHYDITCLGSKSGEGNSIELQNSYKVSVYATKTGYINSDVATKEIKLGEGETLKGDANGDGVVDIADAVKIVNTVVGKE